MKRNHRHFQLLVFFFVVVKKILQKYGSQVYFLILFL